MMRESLLLLHGALGSAAQLQLLKALLSKHFTVYTLDFSGHGGEPFKSDFSIAAFADEVLTFLDVNIIEKTHIFGYSMGGYVALHLAKLYPDKIDKIFTLGTKFDWNPETAEREVKMLKPLKIKEKIPAFAKILKERHEPNDWEELLHKTAIMMLALGNGGVLKEEDFKNIKHHIIIGIGSEDNMVTLAESQAVAAILPHGKLLLFSNFKHPIEQIDIITLADAIELFIKSE
ncbi:MAG: alpha/beta fold hydrolase [Saprospiraceae bacterium]|nr:alpha/beta fold hydrolase [Saprospiraceae bacterium]